MNYKAGLDNLKPEVLEAAKYCDEIFDGSDNGEWATIRAELLRLAEIERAQVVLRADRIEALAEVNRQRERAERAEAANRDCVAHFEQMQAERDQAQDELAALKRRVDGYVVTLADKSHPSGLRYVMAYNDRAGAEALLRSDRNNKGLGVRAFRLLDDGESA